MAAVRYKLHDESACGSDANSHCRICPTTGSCRSDSNFQMVIIFFGGHFTVCSHCNVGQRCVSVEYVIEHPSNVKMLIIKSVDHRDKTLKNSQKNIFQENFGKIACRQPEHFTASRMGPLCTVYSLQWSICQKAESISCSALQSLEVEAECSRHT